MNVLEVAGILLVLVVARVGGFMTMFPLFRSGMVPRLVKVGLTLALSILWLSNMIFDGQLTLPSMTGGHAAALCIAIARETIIGGLLGFLLGLFFIPAQVAGYYLGQEIGFNMAGMTDPSTGANSNVFGDLLSAIATLTFLLADAHQLAFGSLFASFSALPLAQPLPGINPDILTRGFADAHRWGLELAAPVGAGLFLTTVVTALLMKISPQLNLFAVGIPLRLVLGLGIALLFFPDLVAMMERIFLREAWFVRQLGL